MKTWLLAGLLFLQSYCGYSQIEVKDGVRHDTIVKTGKLIETTTSTPRQQKTTYVTALPKEGNWNFEGSFGMAFGNQTTVNIIPQVRYSQSVYFSVGAGMSYSYYYLSHKGDKQKMNYIGLNTFARVTPFPYLAFQVQPEIFRRWGKDNGQKVAGRFVPTFLAGGGFIIPAGYGNVELLFLFDIIQNKYTPYGSNLYYTIGYSFPL